jgi:hypothetical protein
MPWTRELAQFPTPTIPIRIGRFIIIVQPFQNLPQPILSECYYRISFQLSRNLEEKIASTGTIFLDFSNFI